MSIGRITNQAISPLMPCILPRQAAFFRATPRVSESALQFPVPAVDRLADIEVEGIVCVDSAGCPRKQPWESPQVVLGHSKKGDGKCSATHAKSTSARQRQDARPATQFAYAPLQKNPFLRVRVQSQRSACHIQARRGVVATDAML